ncbi:hypothetical protein CAL7716_057990 [Calothrix sp. PCC 7716]|nr:hypothetical protein CAL7716_057990 [Calothrix sp. PCC 7716]
MAKGPIRRAQLIAPFSVGAMVVVRDGTSLITAGTDHWYKRENGTLAEDLTEYRVEEWRLARTLGVNHFRLPPDFRKAGIGDGTTNAYVTVPFLRFPTWHICPSCNLLRSSPLTARGKVKCPECEAKKQVKYMDQAPIVAMCQDGHIQDFPWREWVHQSVNPNCQRSIRLIGTGSATLGGLQVRCDCGAKRSLNGILNADEEGTTLSRTLDRERVEYLCQGKRPWLGTLESEPCGCQLRGSLRAANNIHYAQVKSAIYLQRGTNSELLSILEQPPLSTLINKLKLLGDVTPLGLREFYPSLLQPYSNTEIQDSLLSILSVTDTESKNQQITDDDQETSFRREEFNVLCTVRNEANLKIRQINLGEYTASIARYFSKIMLVDKLKETRVLTGFTRIFPETDRPLDDLQLQLRRSSFDSDTESWLPAYVVYGEGIFIEFNEHSLRQWLAISGSGISSRVEPLTKRYNRIQQLRKLRKRQITPRFLLLHTFAHLLINRLTFECGYSSAALRERLYVSDNPKAPMAGVLIYTAAGDSEGTMGGLVRMGKPGNFEPVLHSLIETASWCSSDPVCMEVGITGGQGPDSCNLAACHSCTLVPETTCEEFNRFLDRGVVVGDINNRELGYFTHNTGE